MTNLAAMLGEVDTTVLARDDFILITMVAFFAAVVAALIMRKFQ